MASPSAASPLSLRNGVRVASPPSSSVEQVLLAIGEQVGHANISYASRMNKALVVFLTDQKHVRTFWHFNVKLLNDFNFCDNFKYFWFYWQAQKEFYTSLIQWWEVGKAQIKVFTQRYSASSTTAIKKTVEQLEKDVKDL